MKKRSFKKFLSVLCSTCLVLTAALCLRTALHADGDEETMPDNGIPVVYLNIDESRGSIADMLNSPDHSVYCYGAVSIDVPEGFHYSDFADLECISVENLSMSIRGRGNSTWENQKKKPFKIKLDKKADLFGLGANKHWVLVANSMDSTLLKDRITAWLGDEMGFPFTPRGVPVDLVMTGEDFGTHYLGSYYLSENVRVDENRLNIAELKESDTDPDIITGGYLIQNSFQVRQGSPDRFVTSRGAKWATHTPSFDTEEESFTDISEEGEESFSFGELGDAYENHAQQEYIQNYVQYFEDVLYEGGTAYRDLMDVESAAKYWLVQEISLNGDAYATGSTYFYKDRDTETGAAKIFWGPLWDFDYGWNHRVYVTGFPYGHEWIKPMFYDREEGGFVQELHKQWPIMRAALLELIEDGGVIDGYYEETKASAEADRRIYNPGSERTYLDAVNELKDWIRRRIEWVDENFSLLDHLVHKATFMSDGEVYMTSFVAETESLDVSDVTAEKDGYIFLGWKDEDGNTVDSQLRLTDDIVLTADFISESEATHAEDIAFNKDCDVFKYNVHVFMYQIPYTVIPTDAVDKAVEWTSSDESYATVDAEGCVTYNGPGTVTLTGRLKNGVARQFTLTVLEEELPVPESVFPDQEVIRLSPGQQSPCSISTIPSPAKIYEYIYEPEDESVVSAGEYGVLSAVGPGETKVRIKALIRDENDNEYWLETYVTVIVEEDSSEPADIVYTASGDTSWQKESGKDLTLTVKRSEADETCFSHFTGVRLDGALLEKDRDYTAVSGSTVVTLRAAVLETLTAGTHTAEIVFDDGTAEVKLQILEAENKDTPPGDNEPDKGNTTPDTRDNTNTVWPFLTVISLAVLAAMLFIRRRSE